MALIIPLFIPHEGCPHCCSFCNQHRISGRGEAVPPVTVEEIGTTIEKWLGYFRNKTDLPKVAFYGGSFTALPLSRQAELLGAVAPFVAQGLVGSIHLSTRPDCLDEAGVDFLRDHGVRTVELGVQSMDDRVLALNGRGHSASHTREAIHLLRRKSMTIGVQLMTGLAGESRLSLMRTVREVLTLEPDCVRIYPVLVLKGSLLEKMFLRGEYQPLSLDGAIVRATWMKKHFDRHGITVMRIGLQPGEDLESSLVAGPYHPAFGELVYGRLMLRQIRKLLTTGSSTSRVSLVISPGDRSIFQGVNRRNIRRLTELGLADRFTLRLDPRQPRMSLALSDQPQ